MKIKQNRKIGFWAALVIMLSSVVGVGVFLRNDGINRATGYDGVSTLVAWIIGGIIALFAALSFVEIGSIKTDKQKGLPGWVETIAPKRIAKLVKFNYPFFYIGLLLPVFAFFSSQFLFEFLRYSTLHMTWHGDYESTINQPPVWVHLIVAIILTIIAFAFTKLTLWGTKIVTFIAQTATWIPLLTIIVAGLALASTHTSSSTVVDTNTFAHSHFNFTGILVALPMVLFAYDAFLNVGSASNKAKNGTKTISKAILVGMILAVVLYTLLSVTTSLHTGGNIFEVIKDIVPASERNTFQALVCAAIFIATFGVLNAFMFIAHEAFNQAVDAEVFVGSKKAKAKFGINASSSIYLISTIAIWTLIAIVPSAILNNDKYTDFFSQMPTLWFFGIYALTIFFYVAKREQFKPEKSLNTIVYKTVAWTAIALIVFVVGYQLFYGLTVERLINYNSTTNPYGILLNAGPNDPVIKNWILVVLFFVVSLAFFAFPIINSQLLKRERGEK